MWFQTLKSRQTIRQIISANSNGLFTALEYSDKKIEAHMLKRETSPLSLDEGASVAFLCHPGGGMSLVAIAMCNKGRPMLEFRVWDTMTSLGFTAKDIAVQDLQKLNMNEGKFKALVNIPDLAGSQYTVKVNSLGEYLAIAVGPGLVLMWKSKKMDVTISFELVTVLRPSMTVQEISLLFTNPEKDNKKGVPPSLVVGEAGGVRIFTPAKFEHPADVADVKFISSCNSFPGGEINCGVQEIQRASPSSCILSDVNGCLWYLSPPHLKKIHLPSGIHGHGVFAVQCLHNQSNGWLSTVDKNQTINLYKLTDVISSAQSGQTLQPWHIIFSNCQLNCVAFIEDNVLAAGSPSNKSLSLWVGLDSIGRYKEG